MRTKSKLLHSFLLYHYRRTFKNLVCTVSWFSPLSCVGQCSTIVATHTITMSALRQLPYDYHRTPYSQWTAALWLMIATVTSRTKYHAQRRFRLGCIPDSDRRTGLNCKRSKPLRNWRFRNTQMSIPSSILSTLQPGPCSAQR